MDSRLRPQVSNLARYRVQSMITSIANQTIMDEIEKIGYRNTCVDAMIDSGLALFKRDYRFYIPENNIVANYKKLAEVEKTSCIPENSAAGMINFGSPLTLFYSGFADNTEVRTENIYKAII